MRWFLRGSLLLAAIPLLAAQPSPSADVTPASLDEFKAAAARIVEEAGLPGAGLTLVRASGIEWAGGLGVADRVTGRPIDGDTLFRVGSVSKSFVAMALVQLYEDGQLDLDAPVAGIVPEVRIDNPWEATEPVRVRHLLEHTAGFDDMHFNEIYVLDGGPDRPLDEVLLRNPASRRVRWRPGTRMAYSHPGYAVAGRVVEAVAGKSFDSFIRERIFTPLAMTTSTFSGDVDAPALAQGYDTRSGPPVVRRRTHLRPAGALHSSPRELGLFVEMLLNWGELRGGYVIDPEYLSNMEWPRTTAAAKAGVRAGYGLGIHSTIDLPYHVLGHHGGSDGFLSAYGYSPSRDVGFVVLLNGAYAPEALTQLSSLAIRYLKRDVAAPRPESMDVAPDALRRFEGYYHDANPRHAILEAVEFPLGGRTVRLTDGRLVMTPVFGASAPLVPVNDAVFRAEHEVAASLAFTEVQGRPVLAGANLYAEKRARWPVEVLRGSLLAAIVCIAIAPLIGASYAWRRRERGGVGTGGLGTIWTLALLAFASIFGLASASPVTSLATASGPALVLLGASIVHPLAAFALLPLTAAAWVRGLRGRLGWFAAAIAGAHAGLAVYLGWWGLVAFRSWTY
jgi:CubicO group peptidase (beta-lactamase class C family)